MIDELASISARFDLRWASGVLETSRICHEDQSRMLLLVVTRDSGKSRLS